MRISIKFKFSIFLAALLLLTIFILSFLILREIKINQIKQYETYLDRQAKTANIYFKQTILAASNKVPRFFMNARGIEFARQLELLTGHSIVLYDQNGKIVSNKTSPLATDGINMTLEYVLEGKTAYLVEQDDLYYLTPLRIENEQIGVMQIYYSLTGENQFYRRIRQMFLIIGTGIFFFSFILAYFYFGFFANGIIRVRQMVERVREGHYEVRSLRRRDEIGHLSSGIKAMSNQIMSTMKGMEEEQEKLKLAVNKLSLLDQQQKQFIGNVTHEFKTPLTSIKAYIDLMEMYPDDEKLLETSIMTIKSETNRLYEMVDKVLQLSALEKYDFEYNPEKIEIKQLILSVLQSLTGKVNKFGIILETELTEAYVKADKDSLIIILINLLDNAIKYNKTNGKIFVKSYIRNNHVFIEITDTGIGIPSEAVRRVFEPFYTVDKNRSKKTGGTGLGLSLVKKYTDKQGGSITLINTDTNGTTFQISFLEYNTE